MTLTTHGPRYIQVVPTTFIWNPHTLARTLVSLTSKKSVRVLEGSSVQWWILQTIVVLGRMGGHRTEVSHPMETDPQVEEDHQELEALPVERTAIRRVQEDTRVVSAEDHQEAILMEVGPVSVSIPRKRKARENGSSTTKLVLERYRNGMEVPRL